MGAKARAKGQLLAQLPAGLLDPMKLDCRLLRCLNGFREGPFVGKGGNVIGPGSGGIHGKGRLAANSWPANVEVLLVIDSTGQCFLLAGLEVPLSLLTRGTTSKPRARGWQLEFRANKRSSCCKGPAQAKMGIRLMLSSGLIQQESDNPAVGIASS